MPGAVRHRSERCSVIIVVPDRSDNPPELWSVAGRPLVTHTIAEAGRSESVADVLVSTSDARIAELARTGGAEVVLRGVGLLAVDAGPDPALRHVVPRLPVEDDRPIVVLDPTMPLRRDGLIDEAIDHLRVSGADSLFSCTEPQTAAWRLTAGRTTLEPTRSTGDSGPGADDRYMVENGALYAFRPWVLLRLGTRLGGSVSFIETGPFESFPVIGPEAIPTIERLWPAVNRSADHRLASIGLLLLDFDGVLSDNAVLVAQDGSESVRVDRGDGWGVARLLENGVDVMIVSTETNPVVAARARKLKIPCIQGVEDKAGAVAALLAERGLQPDEVAFVGNDVNDLGAFDSVGLRVAVADAKPEVLRRADLITARPGGYGAVREIADGILAARLAAGGSTMTA